MGHFIHGLDPLHDPVPVVDVPGGDGDIADHGLAAGLHDVDGADVAARFTDGRGYLAQHAHLVGVGGSNGQGVSSGMYLTLNCSHPARHLASPFDSQ